MNNQDECAKGGLKGRSEIEERLRWDLSPIYESESDWMRDFEIVRNEIGKIAAFEGKLHNAAELEQYLKWRTEIDITHENVVVYPMMRFYEDTSDEHWKDMKERVDQLCSEYHVKTRRAMKELTTLSNGEISNLIKQNPMLKPYEFFLRKYVRHSPHVLSDSEEKILAQLSIVLGKPQDIYNAFNETNIVFPSVRNALGENIPLTHGNYLSLLQDPDRNVRKRAFEAMYLPYNQNIDVLANTYAASLMANAKIAAIRKYGSALEMHLSLDNVDVATYKNLINVARRDKNIRSRYNRVKMKELNIDELHIYDLAATPHKSVGKNWGFDESVAIVRKAVGPLGGEYLRLYDNAFSGRRVDALESRGKQSGAFSWGTYTGGSYALMNYNGTLDDVACLAHEIGHSINKELSAAAQPFIYYENPIILTEVASAFNECLLYQFLIENSESRAEKKYYIGSFIDNIDSTFFDQAKISDFELHAHGLAERNEPITSGTLNDLYLKTLKAYAGSEMVLDDNVEKGWSRIPHLYNPFYVYKYAASLSAAIVLLQTVLNGGDEEREQYIGFLKAGSHKPPLEILNDAGIDMTKPETFRVTIRMFENLLDQYEALES